MSTRCMIHFHPGEESDGVPVAAIVYHHTDGYPDGDSGMLARLDRFFRDLQERLASRPQHMHNPEYLAAKFIVWRVEQINAMLADIRGDSVDLLDFDAIGVAQMDHSDARYRYHVWCWRGDNGLPSVTWERIDHGEVTDGPMIPDFVIDIGG